MCLNIIALLYAANLEIIFELRILIIIKNFQPYESCITAFPE